MNTSSKQLWTRLQQMGSYLLAALFLFISTAQLFHTHVDKHSGQDIQYEHKEQIQLINKCSICNYYHHIQGQQILFFYPIAQAIINPNAITLNTRVLTRTYEFTIQTIANKGPPNSY